MRKSCLFIIKISKPGSAKLVDEYKMLWMKNDYQWKLWIFAFSEKNENKLKNTEIKKNAKNLHNPKICKISKILKL